MELVSSSGDLLRWKCSLCQRSSRAENKTETQTVRELPLHRPAQLLKEDEAWSKAGRQHFELYSRGLGGVCRDASLCPGAFFHQFINRSGRFNPQRTVRSTQNNAANKIHHFPNHILFLTVYLNTVVGSERKMIGSHS